MPQQTTQDPQATYTHKRSIIKQRWLTTWGIPHIDLEPLGCPKLHHLPRLTSVSSCGHEQHSLHHHCPQVECCHFVQWMRGQRGLDHDTHYINHEQTQRFLAPQKPRTSLLPVPRHTLDTFDFFPNACKTVVILIKLCVI